MYRRRELPIVTKSHASFQEPSVQRTPAATSGDNKDGPNYPDDKALRWQEKDSLEKCITKVIRELF